MDDRDIPMAPFMQSASVPLERLPMHCCRHHCLCGSNPNPKSVCDCRVEPEHPEIEEHDPRQKGR